MVGKWIKINRNIYTSLGRLHIKKDSIGKIISSSKYDYTYTALFRDGYYASCLHPNQFTVLPNQKEKMLLENLLYKG